MEEFGGTEGAREKEPGLGPLNSGGRDGGERWLAISMETGGFTFHLILVAEKRKYIILKPKSKPHCLNLFLSSHVCIHVYISTHTH